MLSQRSDLVDIEIFFTNVLRLIEDQNLTKSELAEHGGLSVSFLSDLTNGKANPSLKIMDTIASALRVPLPALLEMTDLDTETLEILFGDRPVTSLPKGLVHVAAILTEFQALNVKQWDLENRKNCRRRAESILLRSP